MKLWVLLIIVTSFSLKSYDQGHGQANANPCLIVLTDMTSIQSGVREPNDAQTLIRLMLYSDEFDIEELIASSSLIHGYRVRPENINAIVNAYESRLQKMWPTVISTTELRYIQTNTSCRILP